MPITQALWRFMTEETARRLARQKVEAGRLVDELRWRELALLDDERALQTSDALIEAALSVPIPAWRRTTSGLVEQQAVFRRGHREPPR